MNATTILWLVAGCLMLQPLSTDLYLASLPHLATAFQTSTAAVQQTLSLFVIGFGAAQLLSGPLSDRFGRRPVLIGGIAIYIGASLACALASTLSSLLVARFVQAIGCCTAVVVVRALIRDVYTPTEGAKVLARASSLLSLAPIFGPVLGSYLQVWFGWRAAFVFHATFAAVLLAFLFRWLEETHHHPNRAALHPARLLGIYRQIAAEASFWAWALPAALSYASIFVFISGSSPILIRVLGVPTELYGYCFAFGVLGYLLGTLLCRRLIHRFGLSHTLSIGVAISLGAGMLFLTLTLAGLLHWTVVVLCLFLTMLAHGINFPCAQSGAIAPFPQEAGAAAGLLGALTMAAAAVAGNWVGASFDGTVLPLAEIAAVVCAAVFSSAYFLRHRRQA
ncbi:MAG: multidrug effflux MFS transporter [Rhodocyclaceae bacterium]|nr:multidrug effflux MFS transporter [Rhodocyclaceae bacterium]